MREKWNISPDLEKRMQQISRELRRNPTPSETMLWHAIRREQLNGRKFRRQVAIGAFVVDFYCSSEKLIIEVDGSIHDLQHDADTLRQELLESLGLRILRLTNDEIEEDLDGALSKIREMFEAI